MAPVGTARRSGVAAAPRGLKAWQDWVPVVFGESPMEIADPDAGKTGKKFYRFMAR